MRALWPLVLSLLAGGCTTVHEVRFEPLSTRKPVSASKAWVAVDGRVVRADQAEPIQTFQFRKQLALPDGERGPQVLRLGFELDRVAQKAQADALTGVQIQAVAFEPGSHGARRSLISLGWVALGLGSVMLAPAFFLDDARDVYVTVGAPVAGLGLVSLVSGLLWPRTPSVWTFEVRGTAVRER